MNNKYDLGPKVSFTVVPLTDPVQQLGPEIAGLLAANAYRGEDEGATMKTESINIAISCHEHNGVAKTLKIHCPNCEKSFTLDSYGDYDERRCRFSLTYWLTRHLATNHNLVYKRVVDCE